MTAFGRFNGIEAFVVTADEGSFTAAAERLNLTNSAISKSVARLEEQLGTRLFVRTTRRLALSDAGLAFYHTCVRVLADLSEAEAVLQASFSEPTGRLRLAIPEVFGRLRVWPLLLQFAERYPHLRPHVSFAERFVDLHDERIDVAVRIGGSEQWSASLGHRYLGSEQLIFCAAPDYLLRHGTPVSVAELLRHDAVLYAQADGSSKPWFIAHDNGRIERQIMEGRIIVGSAEAQLGAVKAGLGIAQLASWLVSEELRRGELVTLLPDMDTEGLPLNLIWSLGRQLLPKVDAILTLLSAKLCID